jgi:hypothetical protein
MGMLLGYTTLEFLERRSKKDKNRDYSTSPFDLGLYKNVQSVLGPYMLLWFIPTRLGMCKCEASTNGEVACLCGTVSAYNENHPMVLRGSVKDLNV